MAKEISLPMLYTIPANWRWIEMGKVVICKSGFPFDSSRFSSEKDGKKPLIRIRDVVRGKTETYTDENCPEEYIINCDDILIGMDGDFNVAKWQSEKALLNQRVCNIYSSSDLLNNDYLFYYLPDPLKKINDATPSVTVKHLSTKTLCKASIPMPPLSEQKRIVSHIESLLSKLDEAKEKAQAVVDGYEDRKAAILHKAFTGELTEKWRLKHDVEMNTWDQLTLNDVADYKKGPFGSSVTKAMFVPKGEHTYKVYEQGNAIRKTVNYGKYYIDEKKYSELKGFAVRSGDIIISCAGTIGELFILPDGCEAGIINQALMRVRINSERIIQNFFCYYFSEIIKGDVINQANGTAIKNIPPFKVLKTMEIRLPSIEEQNEIVRLIDSYLYKDNQIIESAKNVITGIETMKKSILAKAFRGELGTNDPSEEPVAL